MNSPEKNNYIQYVNQSGFVKTRNVVFVDNGETTTFDVGGVNEDFFIFAVFQNNVQRFGIGFENFDNNDMLGFINTSVVDLGLVPSNAFLASEQVVTMSYNNAYVKSLTKPDPMEFPAVQVVNVNNQESLMNTLGYYTAYGIDGNTINDDYGNNSLNVNLVRNETDDEIYLKQFCALAFPYVSCVIRPFAHQFNENNHIVLDARRIFFAYLDSSDADISTNVLGGVKIVPNNGYSNHKPRGRKYTFNSLVACPVGYQEIVSGYYAQFSQDVFSIGG